MTDFKTGEIVQLKSGGPKMTVKNTHGDGEVLCQWFAGSKLESGYFPKDSIDKIVEEKKSDKKTG